MQKSISRKWLVLTFIFLFVVTVLIPPIGGAVIKNKSFLPILDGKTLFVGGTEEGNYTSIQDAIDNTSDGDTVFVYDISSPYNENIIINNSISLIGEDKETTIIDGSNNSDVIFVSADGVNICGFTIQDCEYEYDEGILISSSFNTINNNIITSNNGSGIIIAGGFLSPACCNVISGNIISSNKKYGIYIWGSSNNSIKGNNIISNNYDGIYLINSISNTIINNNILNSGYGINIHDSNSNIIEGNNISNNKKGINLEGSSSNTINDNNIISNIYDGMYILNSNSNTINGNNISNNECGIYLDGSDYNTISGNIVMDNTHGIFISYFEILIFENGDSSTFNIIKANSIYNNDMGIYLYASSFNLILRNNFIGNQRDAFFRLCKNFWMLNYWNRPRILPKFIFGYIHRPRLLPKLILGRFGILSLIPGVNIDWRPALRPYDI